MSPPADRPESSVIPPGALIYQAVFEQSYHATWILSADGGILAANRRARGLMTPGGDWLGSEAVTTCFPRATAASRVALTLLIETQEEGPPPRIMVEDTDPAGQTRTHEVTLRQPRTARGEPLFLVLEARDVSEVRRMAAEANSARLAAEAADRAKSAFLARMSHEMRTPLHGVLGFARLLLSQADPTDAETQDALRQIEDAGGRLLALVDDVLELARLEGGGLAADIAPCDLPRLLEDLCRKFGELATAKGLALSFVSDPDLPIWVLVDTTRLARALGDLLDNAVQYTLAGTVEVEATWEPEGRRDRLGISIADSGPGIPAADLPRLLSPFESGHRGRAGTGLGLALARRLVELLDGEFRVVSGARGTRVELELPAPAIEPSATERSRKTEDPAPSPDRAPVAASTLPVELREELAAAARIADYSRLQRGVERAIALEPRLKELLRGALDRFDYRALLDLLAAQPAATSSVAASTTSHERGANGALEKLPANSSAGRGRAKK